MATFTALKILKIQEAAIRKYSLKQVFLNFTKLTGKHLRQSLFLIKLKKETMEQVLSSCKIFQKTSVAASKDMTNFLKKHFENILNWLLPLVYLLDTVIGL